jgi:hypothetical protein
MAAPTSAKRMGASTIAPAPPRDDESVRWECADGRWVSIGLAGGGKHAGLAFVLHSGVLCEYVDSYEAALSLAEKWRTL